MIGKILGGRYELLEKIGQGGMSVVYMAINEKANKTWAVKEVRKDGRMDFNIVRQGLLAEIDTLKRLSHPNLPSIVDLIEDETSFIIVMDYIEGRSLDKIIAETGAQNEALVVEWAKQLCDVLGYLHSQKPPIIYRDMKPANVMLKPNGSIMVIDFGTAKNYEIEYGETTGIGTVGYAAPEQYIGSGLGRTDARTDIYCLGITLYYLLTNIDPCKNLISDKSVRAINPALSHGLDAIIKKCTEFQPADRYQSCAELMYDLENYNALEPLHKKKQKKKLSLFFATALLSILLAVSGVLLGSSARAKATDNYDQKLYEASMTADYNEKVAIYEECISIPNKAGQTDAYLGLIKAFKENDTLFTVEEAGLLEKLIKNHKAELQADPAAYTELCFETGKLFWYYYNYGDGTDNQLTRAKSSIPWFQDALDNAPADYENLGMARVYANIGIFYRDITTNITEASDNGQYAPLFANLKELLSTVAANETEKEIVRLEMLELARSAVQQYATKFKLDDVPREELSKMHSTISAIVRSISPTADTTQEKKDHILALLPDTLRAIDAAYGTKKGG